MFYSIKRKIADFLQKDCAREEISGFLEKHKTLEVVLDVGGRNSPYVHLFPNRVCIDSSGGKGVDIVGTAYHLPFPDNSFAVILCTEVFEHLEMPEVAAKEMLRVLKPGGKVFLTTRFLYPIHGEPRDYWRYTEHGLQYVFKDFECVFIAAELSGWRSIAGILQGYAWEEKGRLSKPSFFLILTFAKIITFLFGGKNEDVIKNRRLASGYHAVFKKPVK